MPPWTDGTSCLLPFGAITLTEGTEGAKEKTENGAETETETQTTNSEVFPLRETHPPSSEQSNYA